MIPFTLKVLFYRCLMVLLKLIARTMSIRQPQLLAGPGSSLQLCDAIAAAGVRRLLIVTDSMLARIGLLEPMRQRLTQSGVTVVVYDGVQPDPTIEQIEAGVDLLRRSDSQAVLAIGGGSSIDAAKIISARATNSKSITQMMGVLKLRKAILPLYAVPTTAGTGSEVTIGAVVSDPARQRKLTVIDPKLVPQMAALDGSLMKGLPPAITAATGMDVLTHAIEAFVSRLATPETDRAALEATRLVMQYLPRAMVNGADEEARQQMAWASYQAGLAITKAGVGYVHAISHNFGGRYHTPHGLANAIVLPYVLEYSRTHCVDRLAKLAQSSGLGSASENRQQLADRLIGHIRAMNRSFGIPAGLKALRDADIPQIAAAALQEAHFTYGVPRYMDQARCEQMLRRMLIESVA